MRCHENPPDRNVRLGEGRVGGEHHAFAQVDNAEARRADQPDAGLRRDLLQPLLARGPSPGLGKARRQDGGDLHTGPAAFGYRLDHGFGRDHQIGVVGRFGQRRDRLPGALAQHGLAPRIDRIDRAAEAGLAQVFQRPAGGLGGVVRLPDDRDRAGRQQRPAQGGAFDRMCSCWGIRISARRNGEAGHSAIFSRLSKPSTACPVARHAVVSRQRANWSNSNLALRAILSQAVLLAARQSKGEIHAQIVRRSACRDRAGRARRGCFRQPRARRRRPGHVSGGLRKGRTLHDCRPRRQQAVSRTISPARRRSMQRRRASRCPAAR